MDTAMLVRFDFDPLLPVYIIRVRIIVPSEDTAGFEKAQQ
jgi:hypothetical protein